MDGQFKRKGVSVYTHPLNWISFKASPHSIMDSNEECAAAFAVIAIIVRKITLMRKKLNRQKRSVSVRPLLVRRNELGADSTSGRR